MSATPLRGVLATGVALLAFAAPAAAVPTPAPSASPPASTPRPAPTDPGVTPVLPQPTGPRAVGTTTLHLVDDSRPDPWAPEEKARELMVSLWYPTKATSGPRATYMTTEEAEMMLQGQKLFQLSPAAVGRTRTHAVADAPPAGRKRSLPLVVLSPGFTMPRTSLTSLAEELASRGYLVAGIDHKYESYGAKFPGGLATCLACAEQEQDAHKAGDKITRGRQADVSFVLDRLTGPNPAWKHSALIDRTKIAMGGHSVGGNSSAWTMVKDSRVRAGVNLDGWFFVPLPESGLSRPFMVIGDDQFSKPGAGNASWDRDFTRMTGWKRWLTLAGGHHASYTDFPLILKQLDFDLGVPVSGARSMEITRAYVGAFYDLHLRKRPQPLLNGPSKRYPEVKFHTR
ncbi:alpha/beta hydrolase family protein [Sinosporangium siamense]|uniref:Lipase n=1 Tax=Sinosporangium siamense TaxID=1367973 RepID=A0A919V7Z7_9ACTN|nr:alpha/beta hydrolase [Sinosporangium siamense]GII93631.1 lipase [Sinosporangium siamense]